MKVFINTSSEEIEIDGQKFIPGEWLHLPDDFKIDLVKYPFIKSPQVVLDEKDAVLQKVSKIGSKEYTAAVKDQELDAFAAAIKQTEVKAVGN